MAWRAAARDAWAGVAVLIAAAAIAGCSASKQVPLERGFEVGAAEPGSTPVTAGTIYPLREGTWVYAVAEGGEAVRIRRERTDEHDAEWLEAEDDRRTHYWRLDSDGNLVTTAVIDHDDRALTFFDPPLVAAFAELTPGEARETTASMRVVDVRDPRRQRESGTATQRIEYAGDRRVRTPMGDYRAKVIEIAFDADLRLADASKRRTLYVVPEHGIVLEERREKIVVLGIIPKEEQGTLVLEGID